MGACRDFRHHAAKRAVFVKLAQHHIRQRFAPSVGMPHDHGGGGLVAAGFDAENTQKGIHLISSLIAIGRKAVYDDSR
ncbi:hypothetical protein D3C87_1665550 [compost metagenome]